MGPAQTLFFRVCDFPMADGEFGGSLKSAYK